MLKDFHMAQDQPNVATRPGCRLQTPRIKVGAGLRLVNWVKMKWDAAEDGDRKLMGTVIIVRDHSGQVLAAMCSHQGKE
jgi:hypothetical protein